METDRQCHPLICLQIFCVFCKCRVILRFAMVVPPGTGECIPLRLGSMELFVPQYGEVAICFAATHLTGGRI